MTEICTDLHHLFDKVPRYRYPFDHGDLPPNGIYILFEEGEVAHGTDRIVRIGTHNGQDRLKPRLLEHFVNENKDRSIFRKNIGRVILNKTNDQFLEQWNLDLISHKSRVENGISVDHEKLRQIEELVSDIIRTNFSFCVIPMQTNKDRKYYEARLISTVSNCNVCRPSSNWLGLDSPIEKIRESGLWNINKLWKEDLTWVELEIIKQKLYPHS